MKKQVIAALVTLLLLINIILFTGTSTGSFEADTSIQDNTESSVGGKTFAVKLPKQIQFAGESVPLNDFEVKERLDRELLINSYWHSSTIYLLKQANRYFPIIVPILKEHNIPEDFKFVALAESGLQNVVSPSNAVGVWQFLKSTGKSYQLEINDEVDERYHLEKASAAACNYLQDGYNIFHNWTLAAASYNMGIESLRKKTKQQMQESYYDLLLNRETSRYLFRILAFKEIYNNPEKYGFYLEADDLYQPIKYKTVTIDSAITSLPLFAKQMGTNYKLLKFMNPWLRKRSLKNPSKKKYVLKFKV